MVYFPNNNNQSLYECFVLHLNLMQGGHVMFPWAQFADADQHTLDSIERLIVAGAIRLFHHQGMAFLMLTEKAEEVMQAHVNDPELN